MPGFFENVLNAAPSFSSSRSHRRAQRMVVGTEIFSSALKEFSPTSLLIGKVPAFLVSIYNITNKNTHNSEKILHALQAAIALGQTILAISLFMADESCDQRDFQVMCKLSVVLDVIYKALITTGWLPSEIYKDPSVQLP